jgi:hypothetical protein
MVPAIPRLDAGITTEANLVWLRENKYHYVVVSRQRVRQFDMEKSVEVHYAVHTLRACLKAAGIDDSWETLRSALSGQVRITTTMQRRDGRAIHVRKASRAEPCQQRIYAALKLPPNPGGIIRTIA